MNIETAKELVEYGVRHSEIIPKKYLKGNSCPYGENCIPMTPNMQLKTDLVNYIMDGRLPNNASEDYTNMVKTKGTYLYDNRNTILNNINEPDENEKQ